MILRQEAMRSHIPASNVQDTQHYTTKQNLSCNDHYKTLNAVHQATTSLLRAMFTMQEKATYYT